MSFELIPCDIEGCGRMHGVRAVKRQRRVSPLRDSVEGSTRIEPSPERRMALDDKPPGQGLGDVRPGGTSLGGE